MSHPAIEIGFPSVGVAFNHLTEGVNGALEVARVAIKHAQCEPRLQVSGIGADRRFQLPKALRIRFRLRSRTRPGALVAG